MYYFFIAILASLISSLITTPLVCDLIILISGDLTWPFSRILDRVLLFFIILFLFLFRKKIKLSLAFKVLKEELRENTKLELCKRYFFGLFITSFLTLIVIPLIVASSDLMAEYREISYFYTRIPKILIASLVIASIEECFFRVICQRTLVEKYNFIFGIILTNLIYALVHFIKPFKQFQYDGSFLAGFDYTYSLLSRSFDINFLYAFFALFFVGMILSISINKSKSLLLVMGLHAGWILGIKMARYTTKLPDGMPYPESIGREFYLLTFWQAWVSILLVFVFVSFLVKRGFFWTQSRRVAESQSHKETQRNTEK